MERENVTMARKILYTPIIERIFAKHHAKGIEQFEFQRDEIEHFASELGIDLPKNLGDLIYSFRYRKKLPSSILATAPEGMSWVIRPAGKARYRFALIDAAAYFTPNEMLAQIKVPEATPGLISRYALGDEQALLAKLRYNRLLDVFTQVTCYSLQSHLRTTVKGIGQIETDEIYVGVNRSGSQFVIPVQAKGGKDKHSLIQIEQDIRMCEEKFPALICRPIAAQFLKDGAIALFEFQETSKGLKILTEKHYRLVPHEEITDEELKTYRRLNEA